MLIKALMISLYIPS